MARRRPWLVPYSFLTLSLHFIKPRWVEYIQLTLIFSNLFILCSRLSFIKYLILYHSEHYCWRLFKHMCFIFPDGACVCKPVNVVVLVSAAEGRGTARRGGCTHSSTAACHLQSHLTLLSPKKMKLLRQKLHLMYLFLISCLICTHEKPEWENRSDYNGQRLTYSPGM